MATFVGTTHPDTGVAAPAGQGYWFGGQFSGGEPVYYLAALPPAPPAGGGGGGSTGGGSTGGGSTGSTGGGIFADEERRRTPAAPVAPGLFDLNPANYQDIFGRYTMDDPSVDPFYSYESGMAAPQVPRYTGFDDLFNQEYSGRRVNINPYGSLEARDLLRDVAQQLGMPTSAADYFALENQRATIGRTGREYIEVDHPALIADDILMRLFDQAQQPYDGLTPEQRNHYATLTRQYLENAKNADEGGLLGSAGGLFDTFVDFPLNFGKNIFKAWEDDPERFFLGANTPLESELWGEVLGKDYEPTTNMYGGPTERDYQTAAAKGIDTSGAGVLQSAIETAINMYAGQYFAQAPWAQGAAGQAGVATGRAAFSGANTGDLRSAVIAALIQQGIDVSSPYVNEMIDEMIRRATAAPDAGMLSGSAISSVPAETTFGPDGTPISSTPAMTTIGGGGMLPLDVQTGSLPLDVLGSLGLTEAGEPNVADEQAAEQPTEQPKAATKINYTKIAQTIAKLLFGGAGDEQAAPADAPTQDEGETPEQFSQELAQYLSLDPAAMAEQGLEPGTPQYHEYIMAQADSVIAQVLGDIDPNAADLAQQLRAKTQEELLALQRALYVRGQLEQLMGSGTYTDPATGRPQEVVGRGMFNPAVGAYEQGLAQNVEELAGLGGQEAQDYLGGLLGRNVDFFGMQSAQNARRDLARRTEREDEEMRRRRRGMFG